MERNRKVPRGVRRQTVERSCTHAVVRIKLYKHWHDGDWIYLRFVVKATGNYLIKEAIACEAQWQKTYTCGKAPHILPGMHEYNAARLHAIKAIETKRRHFGDQGELFT